MDERRKYIRVEIKTAALIESLPTDAHIHISSICYTKNIGGGGILIEVDSELPMGIILNLKFQIYEGKDIQVRGRVVRCINYDQNKYDVGIEFIQIEPGVQREIIKFCEEALT